MLRWACTLRLLLTYTNMDVDEDSNKSLTLVESERRFGLWGIFATPSPARNTHLRVYAVCRDRFGSCPFWGSGSIFVVAPI